MSLKDVIKAEAHRLGFVLCGVTTPDPPPHYNQYARWVGLGRHAEMAYLASERALQRRQDPRQILPECRSILALGIPYAAPEARLASGSPGPVGQVAAYAWGDDYHDVLPDRLRLLVQFIEGQVASPVAHRSYTDSGPVMERDLAQRAGLGWIGKNTCLIHPHKGSYFLLAEILLGLELPPDEPFRSDHCGSCTRCIDACPTQCILPDRTLDAGRCLSYLTIELKGAIPHELRSQLGEWVFGCDICQQVCPWNQRFAGQPADAAFIPRPAVPEPVLIDELQLAQKDFSCKFSGSPVKRARRRGYLRNVAVALGNAHSLDAVGPLERSLLTEPEALVRQHAAWALGESGSPLARQCLIHALQIETDPQVRTEIALALSGLA